MMMMMPELVSGSSPFDVFCYCFCCLCCHKRHCSLHTSERERERVLRAEKRGREVGFCREYVFFDFFSY